MSSVSCLKLQNKVLKFNFIVRNTFLKIVNNKNGKIEFDQYNSINNKEKIIVKNFKCKEFTFFLKSLLLHGIKYWINTKLQMLKFRV